MVSVKPEQIIEILKSHNVHISLEQAALMLDFMFKFAKLSLTQNRET